MKKSQLALTSFFTVLGLFALRMRGDGFTWGTGTWMRANEDKLHRFRLDRQLLAEICSFDA